MSAARAAAVLALCLAVSPAAFAAKRHRAALPAPAAADAIGTPVIARTNPADARFAEQFGEPWLEQLFALNPDFGLYNGHYRNAGTLFAPTRAYRNQLRAFYGKSLAALRRIRPERLSPEQHADWQLLNNWLQSQLWQLNVKEDFLWNPALYNVAEPIAMLLNTEYAPLDQRLLTVQQRLKAVPAYYAGALSSIKNPTIEHAELAIQQNAGAIEVLRDDLPKKLAASTLSAAQKDAITADAEAAAEAVQGFIDAVVVMKAEADTSGKARSFRLGGDLYETQFAYDIATGAHAKALYEKALTAKEALHTRMEQAADTLWPKYFPNAPKPVDRLEKIALLINHLSKKHVAKDEFVAEVQKQIPQLEAWVRQKDLLTLDPTRPLRVRETPTYLQGTSIASINAPGPYDPTANTFYNVSPLNKYNAEQAESFLQEYNHWIMQVLNIHEAVPGHYVQLLYSNKSNSRIKALFGNGAMVEGWAVYAERMMLESGWGDNAEEMWLMYAKWNLRVVCNTILDYRVHVLNDSEENALKLLTQEAFQSETEAKGKWRRVQLSHVQLPSYFAGYSAIMALRDELKQQQGEQFNLKTFHEQFLSYGSAPVGIIKQLMLPSANGKAAKHH